MIEWVSKKFSFAFLNRVLSGNKNKFNFICLEHDLVIVVLICNFLYDASCFKKAWTIKNWNLLILFNFNLIRNLCFWHAPTLCYLGHWIRNFLRVWCIFNDNFSDLSINFCHKRKASKQLAKCWFAYSRCSHYKNSFLSLLVA